MKTCLIGNTGFVGCSLRRQAGFDTGFNSSNIDQIAGRTFDLIVCAAAPAQKWLANRNPGTDRRGIETLIAHLGTVRCGRFVLISTVDVFKTPVAVDETSSVDEHDLHPYGLHRRLIEKFVEERFERHLIVRLPGLVGPGLRKNVIFDFLNENNLQTIDSRGVFQFYPMVNLWYDLQIALDNGLNLLHLTAEPVSVSDVARLGFNRPFEQQLDRPAAVYDMRSRHAALFGGAGHYQFTRRDSLQAVRAYAQWEPPQYDAAAGTAP